MTALLRKDLYMLGNQARMMLVLALAFSVIPPLADFGSTYAVMLSLMLPVSTISYDEKCRWDRYAAMLPYTPGKIVASKYLLMGLMLGLTTALLLLGQAIRVFCDGGAWDETLPMLGMLLGMAAVMNALMMPCLYRFGTEKGRLVMITLIVMLGLGSGAMASWAEAHASELVVWWERWAQQRWLVWLLGIVLLVALTAASIQLSVRFYVNRRNGVYNS